MVEKVRNGKNQHFHVSIDKQNVIKPTVLESFYAWRNLSFRVSSLILIFITSGLLYNLLWHIIYSKYEVWGNYSKLYPEIVNRSISARNLSALPLHVFQVYQPVTIQSDISDDENLLINREENVSEVCEVQLMNYSFGNSYGKPFIGEYKPPPCRFNRVIMNFTATSQGRQFDRLAIMYLNDIEVWRTSTAEPNKAGIVFEYLKDMSAYLTLWKSPQKLIFDLGNLVDDTYTGPFNTTLSATFSMVNTVNNPADQIIPISSRRSDLNAPSTFKLPPDIAANNITLPQNVNRAVFSVSACGQGSEEFWWQNVLQSNTDSFKDITLYGYSPFREVQILIDGHLAGVQWPFPTIFTGGVAPGLWRPIVGIDAYDLKEHEIDITPWLAILSDGVSHKFEIRVVGIQNEDKETGTLTEFVGDNWLVSGKIFLWQDSGDGDLTTGSDLDIKITDPVINISSYITQNATGANETLTYTVDVSRTISISSTINTAKGQQQVSWTQNLTANNYGRFEAQGNIQVNNQITTGIDESTGYVDYKSKYSYPLWCRTRGTTSGLGDISFDAQITRGLTLTIGGTGVHPTGIEPFLQNSVNDQVTHLHTTQNGTAFYSSSKSSKTSTSYGETSQNFNFLGSSGGSQMRELYSRNVAAINDTLTYDHERILGRDLNYPMSVGIIADNDMIYPLNMSRSLRHIVHS
ncbi:Peptide-N4-asparagine amidase A [Erysiphe neolycopersici]|uniref:Peptide-N4-asparagine amidase A n=1 Tax=Erysiphe neolycopersici TaxID=212602 RepID=A0A420HEM4_9PEZI|nr:Peptide-N4-asparagine amidase A [Erysiphe neolycopersici]